MSDRWELIRAIHSDKTGVPPHVVDYIAVRDILFSCISGISNESIANFFHMDEEYVQEVLIEFLHFDGLEEDLTIRPYLFYKKSVNHVDFALQIHDIVPDADLIVELFYACEVFDKIKEEIIKYDK